MKAFKQYLPAVQCTYCGSWEPKDAICVQKVIPQRDEFKRKSRRVKMAHNARTAKGDKFHFKSLIDLLSVSVKSCQKIALAAGWVKFHPDKYSTDAAQLKAKRTFNILASISVKLDGECYYLVENCLEYRDEVWGDLNMLHLQLKLGYKHIGMTNEDKLLALRMIMWRIVVLVGLANSMIVLITSIFEGRVNIHSDESIYEPELLLKNNTRIMKRILKDLPIITAAMMNSKPAKPAVFGRLVGPCALKLGNLVGLVPLNKDDLIAALDSNWLNQLLKLSLMGWQQFSKCNVNNTTSTIKLPQKK